MSELDKPMCLIDDDPIFCESFVKQCQNLTLRKVESFNSFEEVQKSGEFTRFSCFVVDYDLEDTTGLEVARTLLEQCKNVPVVVVSATNRPWDENHGDLVNVKAFVSKWSGLSTLVAFVDLVTEGREFPKAVRDVSNDNVLSSRHHGLYLPRIEFQFEKYRA